MPLIYNLRYSLEGFTDDGGCTEGIDYWDYGFSHFVMAAIMLNHRTAGQFDLMTMDPKIKRICRYPLAVYIDGPVRACFADSFYGHISLCHVLMINQFFDIPELYACCAPDFPKKPNAWNLHGLSLYRNEKPRKAIFPDAILPNLGTATIHAGTGTRRVSLAVQGGNNGVHHNHNDIGSFLFFKNGVPVLTDPGYPLYAAVPGNFGTKRYDCVYNNTFGHSAPIIENQPQPAGEQYRGVLSVDGVNSNGDKTVHLDMTAAYAVPTLQKLLRTYHLTAKGELCLTDSFDFSRTPTSLYEQFITYETATVAKGGVRIARGAKRFMLTAVKAKGRFTVERLVEESKMGRGQGTITRIRFMPATLGKSMRLEFRIA